MTTYTGHTTDSTDSGLLWLDIQVTTTTRTIDGSTVVYALRMDGSGRKYQIGTMRRSLDNRYWVATLGTTEVVCARSKWELIGEICRVDGGRTFDRRVCFRYGTRRFYVDPSCRL